MKTIAYVGCRTTKERKARGRGISVYEVDENGWKLVQILEGQVNPSFLCLNERQDVLYSIHGDYSEASAYRIANDGTLSLINTVGTHGTNPVHLSLDKSGRWLFVANLQTGSVSVIPVAADGSLERIKELAFISGNGGPGYTSHPHQVLQDATGNWLIVPSQGRLQGVGKITVFGIDSGKGTIERVSEAKGRSGSEPRHCVFHPNNRFCYCLNEKDSTVALYYFNEENGELSPVQILSTLPQDYAGDGWASAIDIGADGKALYVSNRKHDSITVYAIGQEDGRITYRQNVKTGGEQPRFITVSPDGRQVLAANELSDTICLFDICQADGTLKACSKVIETESPVCVRFKTR